MRSLAKTFGAAAAAVAPAAGLRVWDCLTEAARLITRGDRDTARATPRDPGVHSGAVRKMPDPLLSATASFLGSPKDKGRFGSAAKEFQQIVRKDQVWLEEKEKSDFLNALKMSTIQKTTFAGEGGYTRVRLFGYEDLACERSLYVSADSVSVPAYDAAGMIYATYATFDFQPNDLAEFGKTLVRFSRELQKLMLYAGYDDEGAQNVVDAIADGLRDNTGLADLFLDCRTETSDHPDVCDPESLLEALKNSRTLERVGLRGFQCPQAVLGFTVVQYEPGNCEITRTQGN